MKKMVSILGTALLVGAVAIAQTSPAGGTATKSAKKGSVASSSQTGASNTSNAVSTTDSGNSGASTATQPQAGNSGFDATDSSASQTGSATAASGQNGSSSTAYGSSTTPAQSGSYANTPTTPATSSQSGTSDEISNGPVAETVSDSSAMIGWATRSAAGSTGIKYGISRVGLTQTAQGTDGADGKNHHAKLSGLSPGTRYYFQITENGSPVGGIGTFKTTAAGEAPVQSKAIIPQK